MKHIIYTLFFLVISQLSVVACSVAPISFCKTIQDFSDQVIISGKIIAVDNDGIDVEIIDVLRGTETRSIIRIWDGTDFDCNGTWPMNASAMGNVNDSIVALLPLIDTIENEWDVLGDYRRPDYFGYNPILKYSGDIVTGYILTSPQIPQTTSYLHLKEKVENNECFDILADVQDRALENIEIKNLVYSDLEIYFGDELTSDMHIRIYDISGRLHYTSSTIDRYHKVACEGLVSGLYVLQVFSDRKRIRTFKFVKK